MPAADNDSATSTTPAPGDVRLVLVFGGRSAEHDVSCVSSRAVLAAAVAAGLDVHPVAITRDGEWRTATGAAALIGTDPDTWPKALPTSGEPASPIDLLARPDGGQPVVVFPMLHGPMGEDGTVQGLCELLDVPYVGCGVLSSSLCMDKVMAKEVVAAAGIAQANHVSVHRSTGLADPSELLERLGGSVFVKPSNLGSSVGVSRADTVDGLVDAVRLAFTYDEWVLVDERIEGREIECAVLGSADDPRASVPGEAIPGAVYRHYSDKYVNGVAQMIVPADLPADIVADVQAAAVQCFRTLRCEGMARVDFFLEPTRGLLLNEVNTLPGFTPFSMYPSMWAASGLPYPDLVTELVRLALVRHARRQIRTDLHD